MMRVNQRGPHGLRRLVAGARAIIPIVVMLLAWGAPAAASPSCPPDLDGDGNVGFADLTMLLNAWGPSGRCPPIAPEDLTGDCQVGFADLSTLLAQWGACPVLSTGECCLPAGGCAETSEPDCAALGGTYLGHGTRCSPGACGAGVVGACCKPNGICVEIDVPACNASGGTYQGPGVSCASAPCAPGS